MKTFAVISLFISVVLAQSSVLIPTGISPTCTTFLTKFNEDTSLASCTGPIITATSRFVGNVTSAPSAAAVKTALTGLCNTPNECSQSVIRSTLADFYTACTAELTSSPNKDVLVLYDTLYVLVPFKQALCTKDDDGEFCVGKIASDLSPSSLFTSIPSSSGSQTVLKPNTDTFLKDNILFLLLQGDTPADQLCTNCVRAILTSYVSWESNAPYAPGLAQSSVLGNQPTFYTKVQEVCGSSFLQGAVQAAGQLSGGILSGGAARTVSASSGTLNVVLGALTLAMVATL